MIAAGIAVLTGLGAGLGIGIVPKGAAKPYFKGLRLHPIDLNEPWARRELKICVRTFNTLPVAAQMFVRHLQNKG